MTARNPARPVVDRAPGSLAEPPLSGSDLKQCIAELLDPDSWGETLSPFGNTMRLAVALTDIHGNLLGPCHNPQPVWSLAMEVKPESRQRESRIPDRKATCPFCLTPDSPCSAVVDALATGEITYTHDQAGLAHAAIPLFLGNQRIGALIAGQTFAEYPQPLALQRIAKDFGASPQEIWSAAIHQVPVSRATLRLYADLLASLGHAFLRQRYATILARKLHRTDERYRLIIEGSKDHASKPSAESLIRSGREFVPGEHCGEIGVAILSVDQALVAEMALHTRVSFALLPESLGEIRPAT
jgi:ligand-binding sensor protein